MALLTAQTRALLESDALAHLVTLNPDGSPQVSCVWVGLDGAEIVTAHMQHRLKVRNVERDPRVVLSIEATTLNERGLREYLVVHGRARVLEGGARALLQDLAHVYLGPDAVFPPPSFQSSGVRHADHSRESGRRGALGGCTRLTTFSGPAFRRARRRGAGLDSVPAHLERVSRCRARRAGTRWPGRSRRGWPWSGSLS